MSGAAKESQVEHVVDDDEDQVDEGLQKGMGKVTDAVAEEELDSDKLEAAMKEMEAAVGAADEAKKAREAELKLVKVDKEDVTTLAAEFELTSDAAKRALQEAGGSLQVALETMVTA